ncbi:MAG TPA: zinc-ribbon domain-containing protein [Thermoproteota archaeon]|nr:zinc-ribbon domain-containing protein [Thermoproteota archaeon]
MSYDFFSEDELRHEVELTAKQTQKLRQQLDKLLSLRSEGKVSDPIFKEVLDETANRYNSFVPKVNDLRKAVEAKLETMREEDRELRHNLESLEVRFTIGSIPEDQYKVNRASYMMRLQNIEEFGKLVTTSFGAINEDANKLSSALMQVRQTVPRELSVEPSPTASLGSVEPAEKPPTPIPSVKPVQTKPSPEKPAAAAPKGSQPAKVRICSRCGAENPDSSLYCYNCGAKI